MTVIKGNFRPDILLVYEEVAWQLRRNGWDSDEYLPSSYFIRQGKSSRIALLGSILRAMSARRVWAALRDWKFFFEDSRPRIGRMLDFFSFSRYLDSHAADAVFILNQRHSAGACYAARLRGIPIVTHQHGDYYNNQVLLTRPMRDIEGPDTIRIVWNEESRKLIEEFAPRGSFRIAGSLKHANIQRKAHGTRFEPGFVFFETIFPDAAKDRRVAEFSAKVLGSLQRQLAYPVYVALHPSRGNAKRGSLPEDALQQYAEQEVRSWPHPRDHVEWAICSDSNALLDLVASGTPCLHLKREDSYLAIPSAYPGTIEAYGDIVAQVRQAITSSDRTTLAEAQLAFLQQNKMGSPATVDQSFTELLSELEAGKVMQTS